MKSEAALARAAGVMVSPQPAVKADAVAKRSSPAVKSDAVPKAVESSGPAVPRDAAKRAAKRVKAARRVGPTNRRKKVNKRILKKDREIKKLVSYIGHLKLLRETLARTDPQRPTFQEFTRARADLRRKLPAGTIGDNPWVKLAPLVMRGMSRGEMSSGHTQRCVQCEGVGRLETPSPLWF